MQHYSQDKAQAGVLEDLPHQERAVALERPDKNACGEASALVMFGGHRAFPGWPDHEELWRAERPDIAVRAAAVAAFYAAHMEDPASWLRTDRIKRIVWLKRDHSPERFARIRGEYTWREFYGPGDLRVGVSCRTRSPPGHFTS